MNIFLLTTWSGADFFSILAVFPPFSARNLFIATFHHRFPFCQQASHF
jgi:hypothetical protein